MVAANGGLNQMRAGVRLPGTQEFLQVFPSINTVFCDFFQAIGTTRRLLGSSCISFCVGLEFVIRFCAGLGFV
jgi:peroxiredoxin